MEEQTLPSPQAINPDDLNRALMRQHKIIGMLKDQIGSVVLANIEQAAQMEDMREEMAQLRAALADARGEADATH